MYWRATSIRFSRGRSTPAMRAIRLSVTRRALALALLVAGVGRADDPHGALALDDLALVANLLDRRADLHDPFPSARGFEPRSPAPKTKNPAATAGGPGGSVALRGAPGVAARILRAFPGGHPTRAAS